MNSPLLSAHCREEHEKSDFWPQKSRLRAPNLWKNQVKLLKIREMAGPVPLF